MCKGLLHLRLDRAEQGHKPDLVPGQNQPNSQLDLFDTFFTATYVYWQTMSTAMLHLGSPCRWTSAMTAAVAVSQQTPDTRHNSPSLIPD